MRWVVAAESAFFRAAMEGVMKRHVVPAAPLPNPPHHDLGDFSKRVLVVRCRIDPHRRPAMPLALGCCLRKCQIPWGREFVARLSAG